MCGLSTAFVLFSNVNTIDFFISFITIDGFALSQHVQHKWDTGWGSSSPAMVDGMVHQSEMQWLAKKIHTVPPIVYVARLLTWFWPINCRGSSLPLIREHG